MKTRSGYLFRRTETGNWYVRIVVNGKAIVRSTGTTSRRDAEKAKARLIAPYVVGGEVEVLEAVQTRLTGRRAELSRLDAEQNPPPKIKRIWRRFMESPERPDSSDSTLKQYAAEWKRFSKWLAKSEPGIEYLHEISPAAAAAYAKDMRAARLSASTFNQHRNLLKMVWRVLADECRLTANPWQRIATRKLSPLKARKRALTPAQFDCLIAAAEGNADLKALFIVLAWTGLRLADAVLIKWRAVDFGSNVITLAPIKTARRQGKLVHIPIFPAVLEILNGRQQGNLIEPGAYVFPELARRYSHDASSISKSITETFEKAGMQTTEKRADRQRRVVIYGAHSLRHFFTTAATAAGMPAAMVKTITGHATDQMLEHYQQIGADLASELALRIQGKGSSTLPDTLPETQKADGDPLRALQERVRELAGRLDGENWQMIKEQLLIAAG